MDIQNKVIEIIADKLSLKPEEIKVESKILDDLGADSLDVVEMLMALEEEYGITIPVEEATELATIQDVINVIQSKL